MLTTTGFIALAIALFFVGRKLRNNTPATNKPELVFDGLKVDQMWFLASDPTLGLINGTWHIFFNSISMIDGKIYIISAKLPSGASLSSKEWTLIRDSNGYVQKVISPSTDEWDTRAVETSDYVIGYDATAKKWVERLYFTGWPNSTADKVDYRIAFSEKTADGWIKHPPVLVGEEEWEKFNPISSFIGDEAVIYEPGNGPNGENGIWHMWYQSSSSTMGVSLAHATSLDGVKWENKKRLTHPVPFVEGGLGSGPFHLDVTKFNNQYIFVGWVCDPTLKNQGLWLVTSSTPDGSAPGDFTKWKPILMEKGGLPWYFTNDNGSKCHGTGLFSATLEIDRGELWVYFTGVGQRSGSTKDPCVDVNDNVAHIGRIRLDASLLS